MRGYGIALLVGVAVVFTGCGTTKTVTEKTPPPAASVTTPSTTTTTTAAAGPTPCATANIAHGTTTGSCTLKAGVVVHYAPRSMPLHLKTLIARVVGVRGASTVSNGSNITSTANGQYLIVTLSITNIMSSPASFDGVGGNQTMLEADEKTYTEAFKAENEADPNSFVTNNESIQPGESKTGDVIFDLPPSIIKKVLGGEKGGVFIGNFGDDLSSELPSGVGVISLEGH